eukprot:7098960-Ditylum_brightwellii.AAC.1
MDTTCDAISHASSAILSLALKDVAFYGCFLLFLAYVRFAWKIHLQHEHEFGGKRVSRNSKYSPNSTYFDPPELRGWKSNQQKILKRSMLHPKNFGTCELLEDVKSVNHDNQSIRLRRLPSIKDKARVLDMDNIYISYFQMLWAFTFVGPFSYLLWKKGVSKLRLR